MRMQRNDAAKSDHINGLRDYMKHHQVPKPMRTAITDYYSYLWLHGKIQDPEKVPAPVFHSCPSPNTPCVASRYPPLVLLLLLLSKSNPPTTPPSAHCDATVCIVTPPSVLGPPL